MKKYIVSLYVETDIPIKLLRDKEIWQNTFDKSKERLECPSGTSAKIISVSLRKY